MPVFFCSTLSVLNQPILIAADLIIREILCALWPSYLCKFAWGVQRHTLRRICRMNGEPASVLTLATIPKAWNYLLYRRRISTSSTQRVWSSKFSPRRCFNANIKDTERQDSWSRLPESSLGILASILIAMLICCEILCGPVAQKRLTEPLSRTFTRNLKSSATVALSAPAVKGWWQEACSSTFDSSFPPDCDGISKRAKATRCKPLGGLIPELDQLFQEMQWVTWTRVDLSLKNRVPKTGCFSNAYWLVSTRL